MFLPENCWWTTNPTVPDGVKFLCERWWELLKDWHVISTYAPACAYPVSLLEDTSEIIEDLRQGRLRTSHQIEAINEELRAQHNLEPLQRAFPSEAAALVAAMDAIFSSLPAAPQDRYSEIKKRDQACKRAGMAARRLHHRCSKRRVSDADMTWIGYGGIVGRDLLTEVLSGAPNFQKIDRLAGHLLLDCVYRGHDIGYLTSLLDRYLKGEDLRGELMHALRRLHSRKSHRYRIYFSIDGANSIKGLPGDIEVVQRSEVEKISSEDTRVKSFLSQRTSDCCAVIKVERDGDPDSGAAVEGARRRVQEMVDYLDFTEPSQRFKLGQIAIVTYTDQDEKLLVRQHPDDRGERPARERRIVDLEPRRVEQLQELSEALRWAAVARRERTPEVSLLASWFAFEFLAGEMERTPVEGIMGLFPKVLAVGNLKRRLDYWWKSLLALPAMEPHVESLKTASQKSRNLYRFILDLLSQMTGSGPVTDLVGSARSVIASSVLLRERTNQESKVFSNPQLLAETLSTDDLRIRCDMQRFLYIRNKLVHRARIDHPLLVLTAQRSNMLLDDLLHDISTHLAEKRLRNSLAEVVQDFRDTYDELKSDLGKGALPADFHDRIVLA